MLKALFRKQLMELNTIYFMNKKTGKLRSKANKAGTIFLYVALFLFLAVIFFFMANNFSILLDTPQPWLFFSIMGITSVLLGVFGSVFNTYSGLYHAKDNDLLLSMPIPPSKILASRLIGVATMSLLYESLVIVPAVVVRFIHAPISALGAVNTVLLIFVLTLLITVFTCALGWIVALISAKFKNRSFLIVIVALIFFFAYYYFCSQFYYIFEALTQNSETVGKSIKSWLYIFYLLGLASEGDGLSMLLFCLIVFALLALTWIILSKTFVKIATSKESTVKKEYKERAGKAASMDSALFRKELKRFTASANYMLNCGLGTVFMLIGAVVLLIYSAKIQMILPMFAGYENLFPVIVVALVLFAASMNDTTAPSVSLEGKSIWILQALPVPTQKVFDAKVKLHCILTMIPAAILTICAGSVFGLNGTAIAVSVFTVLTFIIFAAYAGLAMNLKKPNLTWTNEVIPVKQSGAALAMIFGTWAVAIAVAAGGYFSADTLNGILYLLAVGMLLLALAILLRRWVNTKGAVIFENL